MRKMGLLDSLRAGLKRSREAINEIFYMGDIDNKAVRYMTTE